MRLRGSGQKPANSENPNGGKENVLKADVITATKNSVLKNSQWITSSPLSAEENQQRGIWSPPARSVTAKKSTCCLWNGKNILRR